jgi:hypothetical protein
MFLDKMSWVEAINECSYWKGTLVNYLNFKEFSFVHTWRQIALTSKLSYDFSGDMWSSLDYNATMAKAPLRLRG